MDQDNKNKSLQNKTEKRGLWILIVILVVVVTNLLTFIITFKVPIKGTVRISKETYNEVSKFEKLFIVKDNLEKYYNEEVDEKKLIDGAISGMAESLDDPYTVYMNEEEYKSFNGEMKGDFVGIGVQLDVQDNKIIVASVFDESPAKEAGIMAKDIIEKVDGEAVNGKQLDKAISMMRGKKNTSVVLTIKRGNNPSSDIKVKRKTIETITVRGKMLDNETGYVQISVFDEHTDKQFNKEIEKLKQQGMKGLIVDLRQNPGGWLTQCVDVTSNFLPKDKLIVSNKNKYGEEEKYYSKGGSLIGTPLVVLVDDGTASASEIFSGAVRDYKIGTLVGVKTFGKGVVQTVLDDRKFGFGDGTALKITTSKYYTPNGENIQHKGIKPDIEVEYPKELLGKPYDSSKDPQLKKAQEVLKQKMK